MASDGRVLGRGWGHAQREPRREELTLTGVPNITLNNGVEIPQLGFGVFQIEPEKTKDATLAALEVGYRHIDTAEMYGNEKEVGEARPRLRASTAARSSSPASSTTASTRTTTRCAPSTRRWRTSTSSYLDLFLVHWPLPGRRRLRRDLAGDGEDLRVAAGSRRSASRTSSRTTCAGIHGETSVTPAVNQIEVHPYLDQRRGARVRRRARHRHRGLVADRAGQGARRPGHRADRREPTARRRPR